MKPTFQSHSWQGTQRNCTTTFKTVHLAVSCPACGAFKGSGCRNRNGSSLQGRSHQQRVEKLEQAR